MTRRLCGPLAALLVVAGCASSASDDWPAPDPAQPVVDLLFVVASDLHSVDGRETVTFTPDREVCELVFRAWPNKPATAVEGNALEIADVRVDGTRALPVVHRAGAPADHPGTLVEVPLPRCVPPGETVRTELTFTLTLGEGTDERVGVSATGEAAWFATAFPMLAWQRGRGWATDPAVDVVGEMATSETFRLDGLTVVAPAGYEVLGTGAVTGTAERTGTGRAVHRFTDPAVRDVAVTVGDLDVVHRTLAGVRVHLGTPRSGTRASPDRWLAEVESAIRELTARLGPFPYSDLWITVVPDQTDGVEVAGAIQFGDLDLPEDGWLVVHEVAHMWFYGLVGNNQAAHPWLDESFATYAQALVEGDDLTSTRAPAHADRRVGEPMTAWAQHEHASAAYVAGNYTAGGTALLEARRRAGPEAFDDAVRQYLRDNAHRVAEPADVEAAFAHLPDAVDTLRQAGALGPVTPGPES